MAPDEPSFAGKPNLRRPVRGEPLPHIPGQHAELLSSGSEGWDTPDEQVFYFLVLASFLQGYWVFLLKLLNVLHDELLNVGIKHFI